jgi:DNA replication and repair protein RecF
MRLRKLILEQFRNYGTLELDFDPREPMTYIVGPNAQGKTNILEAIYLLALTKSFRTSRQQDMIRWESEYARVTGIFEAGDAATPAGPDHNAAPGRPGNRAGIAMSARVAPAGGPARSETLELETFLGKPPHPQKAFKKNGVKTGAANFIGNCQVVFFHPEDLNMLYLGPDLRRAYLNVMNVQVNRKYFGALRSYQKVLKQRNALLHAIREQRAAPEELDVWDEQLVEHGGYLMAERSKTLKYFQHLLTPTYRKISRGSEVVKLNYRHTLPSLYDKMYEENEAVPDTEETWRTHFTQDLNRARPRDLQALVTTVGPHRDDLEFSFNGFRLSAAASRGEYRSLLLALKLIELNFFEEKTGENPILLLDDVFSELDTDRQNLLLHAIEGHQTIITATHLDPPPEAQADTGSLKSLARGRRGLHTPRPGKHLEVNEGTVHEHAAASS